MRLRILGSGSCLISQERTSSGYLLESGKTSLMLDTGTGSAESLRRLNVSTDSLDAIINTHRHPDHVSDLVPIIQDKVVRSFQNDESDLSILGPEGHKDYLERRMWDEMRQKPDEIEDEFGFSLHVGEVEEEIGIFSIDIREADHGPEDFLCLSLRFSDGDKDIVFTGDTDYFDGLVSFADGADAIIADCSKPDDEKVQGHMTPSECARLAKKADSDLLILSHLYPEAECVDIKKKASKIFKGEIIVAEDLMKVEF